MLDGKIYLSRLDGVEMVKELELVEEIDFARFGSEYSSSKRTKALFACFFLKVEGRIGQMLRKFST